MFRQTALAAVMALTGGMAHAAFSYDHIGVGFGEIGSDAEALFVEGSKSINRNLHVLGGVYAVDTDYGAEGMYLEGGLGYSMPLAAQADFFVNAQVLYANFDVPGDDDDVGAIARAGLRYAPMERVELEGAVAMSNNDLLKDDGVGFNASARYYFDPRFSAGVGYSQDTELDGAFLNVRYHFQ